MSWPSRHVSRFIDRPPSAVMAFLDDKHNLPRWAAGLSAGLEENNGKWFSESPMGRVEVVFAKKNDLGIFDHDVVMPNGETFHNPLRVLKNDRGSEVVFTLFRRPGVSDADYERDGKLIEGDLERLRGLLEAK